MKDQIRKQIQSAVEKLYPEHKDIVFAVDVAPPATGAEYASNIALILGKKLDNNPSEIAAELDSRLRGDESFTVSVAPPGFLNFVVSDGTLHKNLRSIIQQGDAYGGLSVKRQEKVLIEYFQPNIAKPLHIGHMRSAIIGDCLYRMEKLFVETVESDTHMGDWGTQFGILIWGYKEWGNDKDIETDPIGTLNKYYIRANAQIEKDPGALILAKREFIKLEQGGEENRKIWKKFVNWSMERFLKINELLDISEFDHHWPESFYEDKMPGVLERLKKSGLLKESEGAQIVDLESGQLGVAVIVKSDGGTTYLLRDLATYLYRKHERKFSKQIYVVDNRQSHHFRQLFKILELLGEWKQGEGVHVDFGFMSLPEGAMSTRKGNVIELETVVAKATDKAKQIIAEKNPDLKDAGKVARGVAIGALKYFDLSHNRRSDIVFTWDKALNFDGNTGPYLQYSYARIKSILRKAAELPDPNDAYHFDHPIEREILGRLEQYGWKVVTAAGLAIPNTLTDYLYELASKASQYYQEVRVLQEADEKLRRSRLALLQGIAQVLKNGLDLLGIEAPEEM